LKPRPLEPDPGHAGEGKSDGVSAPFHPLLRRVPLKEGTSLLRIRGLTKKFGSAAVLDGFALDVAEGSFTALLGPSGCGKSTLFNVLTGILPSDGGSVFWQGEKHDDLAGLAAYMQQRDLLLPWLSLEANALLPLSLSGRVSSEDRRRVRDLLTAFGLGRHGSCRPCRVSGGMRQRCALVRTLMTGKDLILLDEPLSSLDAVTRLDLQDLLLELRRAYGKTIVMVTHDVEEALRLADEVVLLSSAPMAPVEIVRPSGMGPRPVDDPLWVRTKRRLVASLRREASR